MVYDIRGLSGLEIALRCLKGPASSAIAGGTVPEADVTTILLYSGHVP